MQVVGDVTGGTTGGDVTVQVVGDVTGLIGAGETTGGEVTVLLAGGVGDDETTDAADSEACDDTAGVLSVSKVGTVMS